MSRTTCPTCHSTHVKRFPGETLCLKCGTYFDPYEGLYGQDLGEAVMRDIRTEQEIAAWERGEEE